MMRFLSHIVRFIIISLAFLLAIVAACAFMLTLGWGGLLRGDPESERLLTVAVGLSLPVTVAFAGYYTFLPTLIFAVVSEVWGKRSWLFHALGGMGVAVAGLAVRSEDAMRPGILMIALAAGAVGGTVYWLVAGRSAGKHLDAVITSAPTGS